MSKGPVRRSQLIAPFGVGAMLIARDGMSLVTCGLDSWYKRDSMENDISVEEYKFEEMRLQQQLNVNHFRLPPDYREQFFAGQNAKNCEVTIPFLRFPRWHFCPGCHTLRELPFNTDDKYIPCDECSKKSKRRYLVQVPFVAMCGHGHLQDFPWRAWVHETANPTCSKLMTLKGTGEASLAGQQVECECGAKRTLAGITDGDRNQTYLSSNLQNGKNFLCQGGLPWHGIEKSDGCSNPLKGTLRSAANVYYAKVKSAIYLPRGESKVISNIVTLFEKAPLSLLVPIYKQMGNLKIDFFRGNQGELLQKYSDEEIMTALDIVSGKTQLASASEVKVQGDDPETEFKRAEFNVLRTKKDKSQLLIRDTNMREYDETFQKYFSNITLVHKLRETRVLSGFNRIFSENQQSVEEVKSLLWRRPQAAHDSWLPAYIVHGEGIFLEFNSKLLADWERSPEVIKRLGSLITKINAQRQQKGFSVKNITPRFLLLHTFAHVLMNRLVFECGYSSASLRERIYSSPDVNNPMGAILIYTAAGDSEGTMGGLVRMGKPGYLEQAVFRALDEAKWCSADPVCMEMGDYGGQGPDSCNLAACHNCGLLPETSCEEFNRYLDRATLIGTIENESVGFFGGLQVLS